MSVTMPMTQSKLVLRESNESLTRYLRSMGWSVRVCDENRAELEREVRDARAGFKELEEGGKIVGQATRSKKNMRAKQKGKKHAQSQSAQQPDPVPEQYDGTPEGWA
jgi:hypothetical protein